MGSDAEGGDGVSGPFRPTVTEQVMNLPLCCAACGEPGKPDRQTNIIACGKCGMQTSAYVAEEARTRRYEALDRATGWAKT